MYEIDVSVFF